MERSHKTGTPAFPCETYSRDGMRKCTGIHEIAYFAARAPEEIPYWFHVEPTKNPPEPKPAPEIEAAAKEWFGDGTTDFANAFVQNEILGETIPGPAGYPILAPMPRYWRGYRDLAEEYETAFLAWRKTCAENELRDQERRYFQWRWYYGEQMYTHRGRD